jgi:hypothetical protein
MIASASTTVAPATPAMRHPPSNRHSTTSEANAHTPTLPGNRWCHGWASTLPAGAGAKMRLSRRR